MPSLLATAPFQQQTFTYETVTGTTTDAFGNPVPVTTTGTITCLFAPYRFDQLRPQPGADPKVIAGRGELIDPLAFPDGVGIGSRLTGVWDGQAVTATITNVIPNDLVGVDIGTYFAADLYVEGG